jgi:BolA protein
MQTRLDRLRAALTAAFDPQDLQVVDDSARHAGHAGAGPGGETHYSVRMVSTAFAGQSRVARSRAVHETLNAEFQDGLHALSLTLRSPSEELAEAGRNGPSQKAK